MERDYNWRQLVKKTVIGFLLVSNFFQDARCDECQKKQSCEECISESFECAWCTQEDFSVGNTPRCDKAENLKGKCKFRNIENPQKSMKIVKDLNLSDRGAKEGETIQIKPQEIKISLRPKSVQTIRFAFRQAVDYPVDLYYLMDLSNSMIDDKEKLAELGNTLAAEMKTITRDFKLGFGSFVEKTVAPFVNMRPQKLKEPCPGCASPYGFYNNMPLSFQTDMFAKRVKEAPTSGNIDPAEASLDALMQAVVCKEAIGWRNQSRKLIVLSTDASFHFAGDGKLGGIVQPNDGECHLDSKGYYNMSTFMDYPSLSHIAHKISQHKVNIIFAVTGNQVFLYEKLSEMLAGSSTGRLEADSSNVVDLVRQQYNKITSAVEITDDVKDSNIQLSYYSSCIGNTKEKTKVCKSLTVGTLVTFDVNIEFSHCPEDRNQRFRTFHIFPVGLHDHLTVNLEMLCDCDCQNTLVDMYSEDSQTKCSGGNGTYKCGICNCNPQRYGQECECPANEMDHFLEVEDCFRDDDKIACSGQGTCRCKRCYCSPRQSLEERVYGRYCECNNFSCDKKDGKICSGFDHGECDCGFCKCHKGWSGDDCSCSSSTETCVGRNGEICSGHGKCTCGLCECDDGEQEYFGTHCGDCSTCSEMCDELQSCVYCFFGYQTSDHLNCTSCYFYDMLPSDDMEVQDNQKLCSFDDDQKCRLKFKYAFDETNKLTMWIKTSKDCPEPVDIFAIICGVVGGVVATGLFLLMLWKILTVVHDRREYAKFEKEQLMSKWHQEENPLYRGAQTTYKNPAYGGRRSYIED